MVTSSLDQALATANALIVRLRESLSTEADTIPKQEKPINPFALASTASALIKAQTTKLTLLSLNKPFTPSQIAQILSTISSSPLPALVTAVQLCEPARFSRFARHELRTKAIRILKAYENLLLEIPRTTEELEAKIASVKNGPSTNEQKAALIGTGLVWEICDEVVYLAEQGLGEMAAKKMSSYRALFNDALEELDGWLEEGKNGGDLENEMEALDIDDSASDSWSNGFLSSRPTKGTIPVAEWALDTLNHIGLLYLPMVKRRLKRLPKSDVNTPVGESRLQDIRKLDDILDAGRLWSEQIDLVAESLFENDIEVAKTRIDELILSAENEATAVRLAWHGSEDEFTAWTIQWSKKLLEIRTRKP